MRKFLSSLGEAFKRTDALSRLMLLVLACAVVAMVYFAVNRFSAPFGMDRTTYQQMGQIDRVMSGKPLYVPLTKDFCTVAYTPFYWWVSAALCKVFGFSLFWPRMVSFVSGLVMISLVFSLVWRQTKHNLLLAAGAAVTAWAAFGFTNLRMYVVQIDALHAALVVTGFYLLWLKPSRLTYALAGVALSLGTLTKQTGIAYVVAAAVFALFKSPRSFFFYLAAVALVLGTIVISLQVGSKGMFWQIVVVENTGPPWMPERIRTELLAIFFTGFVGASLLVFTSSLFLIKGGFWRSVWRADYVLMGAGIAVACIAWPKMGSGATQAIVAIAGILACGAVGAGELASRLPGKLGQRFAVCFVLFQFLAVASHSTNPALLVNEYDYDKYRAIAGVFASGRTLMYQHPSMATFFGQPHRDHYGSEQCRWKNGVPNFTDKPAELVEPFLKKEYDFVLISMEHLDPADPVVRAVIANYGGAGYIEGVQFVREERTGMPVIRPNQETTAGGSLRHGYYVFAAKRPAGASQAPAR